MSEFFKFKFEGLEEFQATIKKASEAVGPDRVEPIALKVAKTVAKAVKSKIKVSKLPKKKHLKNAVVAKMLDRIGRNPASAIAAMDWKKGPHAYLVEYGHAMVSHSGEVVGQVPPHPYFRPAVDENAGRMLNEMENELGKLIEEAIK